MFKRVVVPLDGSPLAEAILPFIMQIAGPLDLEVVLVRVVQPTPSLGVEGSQQAVVEDLVARLADARAYLAPLAAELEAKGVRVSAEVRRGHPVAEIAELAREAGADLIAMTTHGRGGLGRLLFGSVAEAVLREAEIPVFMMRFTRQPARMEVAR